MSVIFDGVLTRLPSSDKETAGLEGTFRGIDNLAFQYEVEQGKLGFNQRKMVKDKGSEDKNTPKEKEKAAKETENALDATEKKFSLKSYTSVLSSPPMLLLLLSHFLLHLGIFSYFSFSTDRAIQFGGLSKGESSLLLSIIGVSNCLGRIVFGQMLDR